MIHGTFDGREQLADDESLAHYYYLPDKIRIVRG